MKHKRTAAMLLAVVLLLTLCACGKSAAPDVTPAPEPTAETLNYDVPCAVTATDVYPFEGGWNIKDLARIGNTLLLAASQSGNCRAALADYTVSDDGTVSVNTAPTVSTDGAALGRKNAAFAWKYTVRDADGDTLTVTEKLDGKTAKTRTGVASGTALTFEQTASAAGFQKILNGNHTITVEVSDGKETVSTSATFTKAVHAASVTLAEPLAVEGDITVAVLQVTGSIPDDAKFKAEVTNNALDSSPVWQDATTEVKKGVNIVFENKTATNGAAFNFRISVSRGASGTGGYIEAVSGAFQ